MAVLKAKTPELLKYITNIKKCHNEQFSPPPKENIEHSQGVAQQ